MKGCSGQLGISQQLTLVMHQNKIGQMEKGIRPFPGQNIDILKYSEQNAILQYTAGHTDNADYAGFATSLTELCSKSDSAPHYAILFLKPANYAENHASIIRQSLVVPGKIWRFQTHRGETGHGRPHIPDTSS